MRLFGCHGRRDQIPIVIGRSGNVKNPACSFNRISKFSVAVTNCCRQLLLPYLLYKNRAALGRPGRVLTKAFFLLQRGENKALILMDNGGKKDSSFERKRFDAGRDGR